MLSRISKLVSYLDRPRAGRLLIACGLFIGLMLAVAVTWCVVTSRQAVIGDAAREMRNDALMLAEEEDRLLRSVDAVQVGLIEHMRAIGIDSPEQFEQLMASRDVYENLKDRIAGMAYIRGLALSDRHGELLNISLEWPPPPLNNADRDFIRELMGPGAPPSFVSAPSRSPITGQWLIYLSRRFNAADGRLIGFVHGAIQINYFEQFYARLPLTGGGAFSLYRRDGMLVARYPHVEPKVGTVFADTENFRRFVDALDGGVIRVTSMLDGQDRLIVPHSMAHFPLIVVVSDTMASILRRWRADSGVLVATTVLLELMLAGTMLLARRHVRGHAMLQAAETAQARAEASLALAEERERAAVSLDRQERRFDTAVQNMPQGLIMLDHAGKVLAINRVFCDSVEVPMDLLPPGTSYARLIELILAAGKCTREDLHELRRHREDLVEANGRATFVWERSDGLSFTVTYQRVEEGWLTTYDNITVQRSAEARIAHLAHHDALTGLPNRVLFHQTLDTALAFARRGRLVALHCLDLDQFKAVNDTLGHPIGDGLLRAVAQRLADGVRDTDAIARLGGDEFAVVQTAIETPLDATALASRLIALLAAPFDIDGHQIVVSTSIGIAFAPQDGLDADQLMKNADMALYRAKGDGRGVYRLFEAEMDAAMQARRIMELDLRQALAGGQLVVYYQPLIDVRARRVAGCEALLRWRHPVIGLVSPDRFIPLAEETGLIEPIGEWVLREACAAAAGWPDEMKVAVNLSAVQFRSRRLIDTIVAALRESGLPANRLELEITETTMLRDADATLATLHRLRDLGIHVAMDDFGTGYSSLSYLRRFPFDRIKIDQSFVSELGNPGDCIAIVRAVIALGRDLGMAITAEGVETWQQLDMLERVGCSEIQGYLFSRPVPASAVMEMLRTMPGITDGWPEFGARWPTRPAVPDAHLTMLTA